jgi:hypothetical protein
VFDKDKMKMLYLKGKRLYTYAFPKANFVASFSEYFYLDRVDYENKKQREIAEQAKGKKINKDAIRFRQLVRFLVKIIAAVNFPVVKKRGRKRPLKNNP